MITAETLTPSDLDYALCEEGINIVQAIPISPSSPLPSYMVTYEFMVKYRNGNTRWMKGVTCTPNPDSDVFKQSILDFARSIRRKMITVTLKSE